MSIVPREDSIDSNILDPVSCSLRNASEIQFSLVYNVSITSLLLVRFIKLICYSFEICSDLFSETLHRDRRWPPHARAIDGAWALTAVDALRVLNLFLFFLFPPFAYTCLSLDD